MVHRVEALELTSEVELAFGVELTSDVHVELASEVELA